VEKIKEIEALRGANVFRKNVMQETKHHLSPQIAGREQADHPIL
jgi:hypothetical protein